MEEAQSSSITGVPAESGPGMEAAAAQGGRLPQTDPGQLGKMPAGAAGTETVGRQPAGRNERFAGQQGRGQAARAQNAAAQDGEGAGAAASRKDEGRPVVPAPQEGRGPGAWREERDGGRAGMGDLQLRAQGEQLRQYQQQEMRTVFENDLSAIRRAYPDEQAKSVDELGTQFIAMCAAGVSPLAAYEALRAEKNRSFRQPPSMGDVRPVGGKGFYTRDEVARMSRSEIERNFERIRRSMDRW